MKKLIRKIINTVLSFFKWVWSECKDWRTLILLGIVSLVMSAPIWIMGILYFVFHWQWALVAGLAVWGFWMLPGAPFFALAVSVTLAIKKIAQKVRKRRDGQLSEKQPVEDTAAENESVPSDNSSDE